MRLTREQIRIIKEEALRAFGAAVVLRLFGSRVDDGSRGGDIDLWVDASLTPDEAVQVEGRFYAALQRRLGERRIDIVVHRRGMPHRPIDQSALSDGIPL